MTDAELETLLEDLESDRVERKGAFSIDKGPVRQAVCAFANDMANHQKPGVIFIGEKDQGGSANLEITDQLLRNLADMRSDGNILPFPVMRVEKRQLKGRMLAVVMVEPSDSPPVRYDGRIWIRVGPRRSTATAEEERRLNERRRAHDLPHDLKPLNRASLHDLDLDLFRRTYLPSAVAAEVLAENHRSVEQQLASLRFVTAENAPVPTVVGMLTVGKSPADFIPGACVQFLRIDGLELGDPVADQREIHGPLPQLLQELENVIKAHIRIVTDIQSAPTEIRQPDYPLAALQQSVRNAVMHRDYCTTHAPVRLYWYLDRIEIHNPGGPFGQVTIDNFGTPSITDYRNSNVAAAMKNLGYVQRFGMGLPTVRKTLQENHNPPPEFAIQPNHVLITIRKRS
ncbi:MAG: putative DNA binding domain-containing protein [Magnetococcales bacterium]|nr:putative DNA binding domain-containing protein [Magnetococcales bacterium]